MARKKSPAPGERRRRRKSTVLQKVICCVLAAATVFCAFIVIRQAVRPITLLCKGKSEVRQMETQYAKDKAENAALLKKRRYLLTPSGSEAEARKLGYVRPGEVSVIIEDKKAPK
ncbi:MAG: hypothetical protein ABFD64_10980 [Armatimonadota bacterium]